MSEGMPSRAAGPGEVEVADRFDAIVVGAGPAGSMAARALALAGRRVALLEKERFPRPKACGGGLTGNIRKVLPEDLGDIVEAVVTKTLFVFKGSRSILLEPAGLSVQMVRRDRFDELLARRAAAAGAVLLEGSPLRGLVREPGGRLVVTTPQGRLEARVVIGADGAASPTARAAGLRSGASLGIAMDADLEVSEETFARWKDTAIFDFGIVPRGYGWSFPKSRLFSVGVGTVDSRFPAARSHLDSLLARHECLRNPLSMRLRSAPLPFWTRHEPLAADGVFLAGDAAGLVDPLSGEGISYALRSGAMAARYADAWLSGDSAAADGYSGEIHDSISRGFRFALRLADIFFTYPRLSYQLGVRSRGVNDIFARLIAGEIDYAQLYDEVAGSWPGRIYRALKPALKLAS